MTGRGERSSPLQFCIKCEVATLKSDGKEWVPVACSECGDFPAGDAPEADNTCNPVDRRIYISYGHDMIPYEVDEDAIDGTDILTEMLIRITVCGCDHTIEQYLGPEDGWGEI